MHDLCQEAEARLAELLAMKQNLPSKPDLPEESLPETLVVETPEPAKLADCLKGPETSVRPVATPSRAAECLQSQDAQVMPRSPSSHHEDTTSNIPEPPPSSDDESWMHAALVDPYEIEMFPEDGSTTPVDAEARETNVAPQLSTIVHVVCILL